MLRVSQLLALGSAVLPLIHAQTLTVDGVLVPANESTVAPAAEIITGDLLHEETVQLTDTIISNLTDLSLTNISLFDFASNTTLENGSLPECKTYPGTALWPDKLIWKLLDLLTGGALIETVPIGAACYDDSGHYDEARCSYILTQWYNSTLHYQDPTSVMSPLYQGLTCMPQYNETGECTLGGFPSYVIKATNVAQIQLAVNFARNLNIRLVVKNTGHDFNGRSSGAGSLSVWTHHLKSIKFYETYETKSYSGPAFKVGTGVQGFELYEAAEKYGVTAVGGEGMTVGYAGGYLAGGGHSPMSPHYGMGADAILSIDLVTPDGRVITADETQNTELFWALRGGGGSTFGVATSYTVKVYPKLPIVSVMTFAFGTNENVTLATFWAAVKAYWELIPTFNDAGNYEYWNIFHTSETGVLFTMAPWFAPNMTTVQLQALTAPLFAKWEELGLHVEPVYSEYNSFHPAWKAGFSQEAIGHWSGKTAARLFPKENFEDPTKFNATFEAIKSVVDKGGQLVGFGITGGPGPYPDNAVNPAWREAAMHVISMLSWADGTSMEEVAILSMKLTNEWMAPWREVSPGSGAYNSEGDVTEPNFQQSFYGKEKYERLYNLKKVVDPTGLFYANLGVGSEDWYVTGQIVGLPTQNGQLCRL